MFPRAWDKSAPINLYQKKGVQTMYELLRSSVDIIFYVVAAVVIIGAVIKLSKKKKNK